MSDIDINKMGFKKLRNEVQLLRDELAVMKRKYEDILYNLDDENFSSHFIREKDSMKAEISVAAEEIKTKVTADDVDNQINSYSIISQTANTINSIVSQTYQTKSDAEDEYTRISSQITQTASSITSRVSNLENFNTSVFTQTANGFTLDGEQTTFTGVIYLTDSNANKKFSIFYDSGSQGFSQVLMHGTTAVSIPLVIGDTNSVYIGSAVNGNEVATRSWVNNNATPVAVFG